MVRILHGVYLAYVSCIRLDRRRRYIRLGPGPGLAGLNRIRLISGSASEFLIKVGVNQTLFKSGYAINQPFRTSFSVDSGMESLVSCLARFDEKLREHKEMTMTEEEANAVVRRVVDAVGVGADGPSGVSFAPVHTYVHQLDKTTRVWPSSSIVVPPFACHWGIVVGRPEGQTLFHLLFVEDAGREAEGSRVENKLIRFHYTSLERPLANAKYVGQTRYNTDQLSALGRTMIQEFGSYHKVF